MCRSKLAALIRSPFITPTCPGLGHMRIPRRHRHAANTRYWARRGATLEPQPTSLPVTSCRHHRSGARTVIAARDPDFCRTGAHMLLDDTAQHCARYHPDNCGAAVTRVAQLKFSRAPSDTVVVRRCTATWPWHRNACKPRTPVVPEAQSLRPHTGTALRLARVTIARNDTHASAPGPAPPHARDSSTWSSTMSD
jgi:hypothetical protein